LFIIIILFSTSISPIYQIYSVIFQALSPRSDNVDVKDVVHRLSTDEDVIADGSRPYILPTIAGKHNDLKSISPETVSSNYKIQVNNILNHGLMEFYYKRT
jgi:hypothetical protein